MVEVVSPESAAPDRGDKCSEYARGGVPEYWLIDLLIPQAECYQLHGMSYRTAFSGATGIYHALVLPGFWLRFEWLWQEPLLAVEEALLESAVRQTPATGSSVCAARGFCQPLAPDFCTPFWQVR